jgi:hypothetical protein
MDFIQGANIFPPQPVHPKDRKRPGGIPDFRPGNSKNQIGLPDWGTPGQGWGAPPPDWWDRPINPDDYLLPEWWPPGMRDIWKHPYNKDRIKPAGFAEGGEVTPEMLLQMLQQGVDPNTQQHGAGQGMPPGPMPGQAPADPLSQSLINTEGYIPAASGFTGKTGGGLAGGLLSMGAEAINGLIDQAASMGGGAANMMAPGSGAAIQMGAAIAKRGVQYAAEMGGIGIGALSEIFLPFGAPRWLSDVDATAFMPSPGVQPSQAGQQPQAGGAAAAAINQAVPPGTPPRTIEPFNMATAQPAAQAGFNAVKGATPPGVEAPPPPPMAQTPPMNATDPMNMLKMFFPFAEGGAVFDKGGVMGPNSLGINLSKRPEYVFTQRQFANMEKNAEMGTAGGGGPLVHIDSVNGFTADEVGREIGRRTRLASMQYRGRP